MQIVRYRKRSGGATRVGTLQDDTVRQLPFTRLAGLWRLRRDELRDRLTSTPAGTAPTLPVADVDLLAPVDSLTEVWACGVTYETSREARVEDSAQSADVYELVYDAERPELFFKSAAWRVSGPGRPIGIRADSTLDVPEPELALIVNRFGEIVGYTVCNDVSSRSIEGENPLYLPQAKVFSGGCALGPSITPWWEVADPYALGIGLTVERGGERVWHGRASTSSLHRRLEQLVEHLFRAEVHPDGAVLSTGTCLVPPPPFTLEPDDVVSIEIDGLGTLRNPVVRGLVPDEIPVYEEVL